MSFREPPQFRQITKDDGVTVDEAWRQWFLEVSRQFSQGYSGTIPLAKLTGGGAAGELVVRNGLIIQVTLPT